MKRNKVRSFEYQLTKDNVVSIREFENMGDRNNIKYLNDDLFFRRANDRTIHYLMRFMRDDREYFHRIATVFTDGMKENANTIDIMKVREAREVLGLPTDIRELSKYLDRRIPFINISESTLAFLKLIGAGKEVELIKRQQYALRRNQHKFTNLI